MKNQYFPTTRHIFLWVTFCSSLLGVTLMPCAGQNETRMPERLRERSKEIQEKMSQHFHRAWSDMKDAMPKSRGVSMAGASMDLRDQGDCYVMRLHLPERDIQLVEANIIDGRILRVTSPGTGAMGVYEQNVTLEGLAADAKPEIEKQPDRKLVIIRIAKNPTDKKSSPESSATSPKELPESTDAWDLQMLEHMRRMGREMDKMFHEQADEMSRGPGGPHWMDHSSFDSSYDLQDEGDHYVVRVYMPAHCMDQVNVSIRNKSLVIEAVSQKTQEMENGKAMMRHMSQYSQTIALPGPVSETGMEIERKRGMMLIRIPKSK